MINRFLLTIFYILISLTLVAQKKSVVTKLSQDTVLMGNVLILQYEMSNINGEFEAPDFKDFDLVGGPNTSSQMSIVNGHVTSSMRYSYYLLPKHEGKLTIDAATIRGKEKTWQTEVLPVIALPNPQGIIEPPKGAPIESSLLMPADSIYIVTPQGKKLKRKLKLYKI